MSPVPDGPLVVGVADRASSLASCAAMPPASRPFDLVEARLDLFDGQRLPDEAVDSCRRLESTGTPVLITIRAASQGGRFAGPEPARLALFRQALQVASWGDVEDDAPIAADVAGLVAARPSGQLVVSHHDFARTPPLPDLLRIADRCHATAPGAIAKIATTLTAQAGDADRAALRALLAQRPTATAVIGMGDDGFRVELAAAGSRLAYGFVGASTAPGQTSAETLHAKLLAAAPAYAARRGGPAAST
jgi:3-dehydroquinate dehydratase-1